MDAASLSFGHHELAIVKMIIIMKDPSEFLFTAINGDCYAIDQRIFTFIYSVSI